MEKEIFLNNVKKYIKLLGLYLNKKEDPSFALDKNELSFFIKLSKHHSLMAFLYQAINNVKANVPSEALNELEHYYLANLRKSVLFDKERNELFNYLKEKQIEYLPLKGIIIKNYYLDPYTREFADNDILFDDKGSALIRDYFKSRQYTVELYKKSNHDVYIKKPFFNFEMHRALFFPNEDNAKNVEYFKDYLNNSPKKDEYEHYLTNENFYIYFLAHSYKHYHVSGCGIRTLIDIYLYLKNNDLDFDYINKELAKLDLLDFSNDIKSLSFKLFDDQELNDEEIEMLLFISSSGTYGTLEHSVSKGVKEKGKFGYMMKRIFPPYSFYKSAYPWAYYSFILIPIAWLCRFFRILFKNPKKATSELKMIKNHKDDKD